MSGTLRSDGAPVGFINVNLGPCDHIACLRDRKAWEPHAPGCSGAPTLIPCPVPRSMVLDVRLADCDCFYRGPEGLAVPPPNWIHAASCAGRTTLATCELVTADGSWEHAHVARLDWQLRNERGDWCPSPMTHEAFERAKAQAVERWATLKGLMLGQSAFMRSTALENLQSERDEMFSALLEMARHEDGAAAAQERALKRLQRRPAFVHRPRSWRPMEAPSAAALAEYLALLLAQVKILMPER